MLSFLGRRTRHEVVEYVKVPLPRRRTGHPVSLQIIIERLDPAQTTSFCELEFCVFSEAGSIGVEQGAGVAERLEHELGGGDLTTEFGTFFTWVADAQLEETFDGQSSVF